MLCSFAGGRGADPIRMRMDSELDQYHAAKAAAASAASAVATGAPSA
jgi:hypothetical protein